MSFKVVPTPFFERRLRKLVKRHPSLKRDLAELNSILERDPTHGTPLRNGCYKVRLRIRSKGKGKSGGARVITTVLFVDKEVYLLHIYDKSEQDSVSDNEIAGLVAQIK